MSLLTNTKKGKKRMQTGRKYVMLSNGWRLAFLLAFLLSVIGGVAPAAQAAPSGATIIVNTNIDEVTDNSSCSLREALTAAANNADYNGCSGAGYGDDTITFDASLSGGTITLTLGSELVIASNVTIDGSALATAVTVSGNNATRVFNVTAGAVTFDSLHIANGNVTTYDCGVSVSLCGGGIILQNGGVAVTVINSTLSGNSATGGGGGGIFNAGGTLTVNNSTLSGNSTTTYGGGGIHNYGGTLTVNNSTLSGNSGVAGGGIYNAGGTLTVNNSTLSGNSGTPGGGGGIFNNGGPLTVTNSTLSGNNGGSFEQLYLNTGTLNLGGTIIANSLSPDDCFRQSGTFNDLGNNLIETSLGACGLANGVNGNIIGFDPSLGPLADNGGPTRTHRPGSGSPAIDAGAAGCGTTIDQRGAARPNGNCDIGAVETHPIAQNCSLTTGTDLAIGDLTFNVANLGTLTCIKVEDMGAVNHLLATTGIQTGQWWHVFGEDGLGNRVTSGFELTLTLPHANLGNPKVCKYPGTQGGYGWDCFRTDFNASTVWLAGVDSFSDWAVGNDVGPTAVSLQSFSANPNLSGLVNLTGLLALIVLAPAGWLLRRRRAN
jgi:CSLREA domain-containing protein